jgi:hypothetical protein
MKATALTRATLLLPLQRSYRCLLQRSKQVARHLWQCTGQLKLAVFYWYLLLFTIFLIHSLTGLYRNVRIIVLSTKNKA